MISMSVLLLLPSLGFMLKLSCLSSTVLVSIREIQSAFVLTSIVLLVISEIERTEASEPTEYSVYSEYSTPESRLRIFETVVPDSSTAKMASLPLYSSSPHARRTLIIPLYFVSSTTSFTSTSASS